MSRVEGTGGSKEIKYVKSKVSNDSSGKVLFNYEQNNDSEFQSHTVSSGETAFSITRKYDITIYQLAEANGWEITAGIHTHKGPDSLRNTPLYTEELQETEKTVFSGTTAEAIALLPTKVNVAVASAVASALATIGPDNAEAEITSMPGFVGDDHCITVETEGLKAVADTYSAKSDIAAWSAVALMRNLSSPMMFF